MIIGDPWLEHFMHQEVLTMQVTSTTTVRGALPLNTTTNSPNVPGRDFLSAMNAAYGTVAPTDSQKESQSSIEEIAPLEHYQTITGRTVKKDPSVTVESWWCDETLAEFISKKFTGNRLYPMDTTKTINWESSGDHKLTSEEIAQLKEKYDVTNLSPQEYYDLMSDLTHMEVLSGSDVMGVHLKHFGSDTNLTAKGLLPKGTPSVQQGNIINHLAVALSHLLEYWDWLNSDEYKLTNSHLSAEKQELCRAATLKDILPRQKMLNVMEQLQR